MVSIEPVDRLTVTTVVDNVSDLTLAGGGPVQRFSLGSAPTVATRFMEEGSVVDVPLAEHGFSALVDFERAGQSHTILFDTGLTARGAADNLRRLQRPLADVEAIVLSHGHFDHTAGMDGIAQELGRAGLPVYIHPEGWRRRRVAFPGQPPLELPTPSRSAFEGAGFTVIEEQQPSFIFQNAALITGEVDRTTEFEQGFPSHEGLDDGAWVPDPLIRDDQALLFHVRDAGLVVISGCGHAGIVNIVRHARRLTGLDDVLAVIRGFHLGGALFEPIIDQTVAGLAAAAPRYLVPAHCTGWRATHAIAAAFPDAFIQNSVGTRYEFPSTDED